jgi:hypothetical protein
MSAPSRFARTSTISVLIVLSAFLMGQECTSGGGGGGTTTTSAAPADADADGIPDYSDNCPLVANRDQTDTRRDGVCVGAVIESGSPGESIAPTYGTCQHDPTTECLIDRDCDLGNACDCDFDSDGTCGIADFNIFLPDFQSGSDAGAGTDMDGDGSVSIPDFNLFLPGFEAGMPGPGAGNGRVVDGTPAGPYSEGVCYERRQGRRIQISEGRSPGVDILDCTVDAAKVDATMTLFGVTVGITELEAMRQNKDNPTDKFIELSTGSAGQCPNAAFSISSKLAPRACDGHDLCLDRCGTTDEDCDLQFARDLFNTCNALTGAERTECRTHCLDFATFYATDINGFLILSPPAESSPASSTQGDLEINSRLCQCSAPVCETDADCLLQDSSPSASWCDRGQCVHATGNGSSCTINADCFPGYRCTQAGEPNGAGYCIWDVSALPDLTGTPPPVCGDGVCQPGIETCTASGCPEDCGVSSAPVTDGFGRCDLGDSCLQDFDCAKGACLHGQCQRLADGSVCNERSDCANACDPVFDTCTSNCLQDSNCTSGACFALQCTAPRPDLGFCDSHPDCQSGLCNLGICVPGLVPNGLPCSANSVCQSGLCEVTCIAPNSVLPGSTCLQDAACVSGNCVAGLCSGSCGDGFCTLLPDGETFANCFQDCCGANGIGCLFDGACCGGACTATCTTAGSVGLGGFCGGSNAACASGTCGLAGICVCDSNSDCPGSKICAAGVCVNPPPFCGDGSCNGVEKCGNANSGLECNNDCGLCNTGETCVGNSDCVSGNICWALSCCDKKGTGASCSSNSQCCGTCIGETPFSNGLCT